MKSLEQLLEGWQTGSLTTEEIAELKRHLSKPEGRAELVSDWLLTEAIYDTFRSQASLLEAKAEETTPTPGSSKSRWGLNWLVWREVSIRLRWPLGLGLACCVVWLGLYAYFQMAKVGNLTTVQGPVIIQRDGRKLTAVRGQEIYPGDQVKVPVGANAVLDWRDEPTHLELFPGTELRVMNPLRGKRLSLEQGALQASVAPQIRWRSMLLSTPEAEAKVIGTQFSLSATGTVTRLAVLEGAVLLRKTRFSAGDSQKDELVVGAGEVAYATPGAKMQAEYLTGMMSSEVWEVAPGTAMKNAPAQGKLLRELAGNPSKAGFVERLRGYLIPPSSGDFSLWIAPFDQNAAAELWLSPDENSDHKRLIAFSSPTNSAFSTATQISRPDAGRSRTFSAALRADWGRSPNQQSIPLKLVKGRRYYLEIWHEGADVSSLALGWRLPEQPLNAQPAMIDLQSLSPFFEPTASNSEKHRIR